MVDGTNQAQMVRRSETDRRDTEIVELRRAVDRYRAVFDSACLVVGHEFIRPLTSISGYLQLIEERIGRQEDERTDRYFEKIRAAVTRMEEMIDSFVRMLRVENRDGSPPELDVVNLRLLVDRVRRRIGPAAEDVENRVDPALPPLYLSREAIEVVVENLVTNAVKYGGDGTSVRVEAELRAERRGAAGGRILVVRVIDSGPGIPPDSLRDIFNPFFRADAADGIEGLGLGLALVKNVIDLMGGTVGIDSDPGRGTTVTFSIPVPDRSPAATSRIG